MANIQTLSKVCLPTWYNKRYSIEYLILKRSTEHKVEKKEVIQELSERLGVTTRTIYNWSRQEGDSQASEISDESKTILGNYFGVPADQILSSNCYM